ncbi:hypothetical protein [Lacrimispora brassicae]
MADNQQTGQRQPKRSYPRWMSLTEEGFHEMNYKGDDNCYYYYNMDREDCI